MKKNPQQILTLAQSLLNDAILDAGDLTLDDKVKVTQAMAQIALGFAVLDLSDNIVRALDRP